MKRLFGLFLAALFAFAPVAQADLRSSSGAFGPIGATSGTIAPTVTGLATLLSQSFVPVSAPADITEDTLATITVPANTIGANGVVRIWTFWTMTNSANNKTIRVRFSGIGGTAFLSLTRTATSTDGALTLIANRNATNSQWGTQAGIDNPLGSLSPAYQTAAVDTTAQTTIVITGQKALNTETLTLEGYIVEVVH